MRSTAFFLTLILGATAAGAASAQDVESAGAVMRGEDRALTCAQLVQEGATISEALSQQRGNGMLGVIGGVVRTGTSLMVPGAGLAFAGMDALGKDEREARLAEDLARMNRWHWLNGLYFGRGCDTATATSTPDTALSTGQ